MDKKQVFLLRHRNLIQLGFEEYYDYIFPGEEAAPSLTILERARQWKKQKGTE